MSIFNSSFGIMRIRGILEQAAKTGDRVHLTGVLGAGQRGLAELLLKSGVRVSGSDIKDPAEAQSLTRLGLEYKRGHSEENVKDAALVAYTLAISEDNPEYVYPRAHGIPTVSRAELAAAVTRDYEKLITVAGSHGKSTVSAMLTHVLKEAGCVPTALLGAPYEGSFSVFGGKEFFIAEACEYKDSFLRFRPSAAIINNIELDHTDYFSGLDALLRSFSRYASRASDFVLLCADDENSRSLEISEEVRVISFGAARGADYRYVLVSVGAEKTIFSVVSERQGDLGEFTLRIPGVFNVAGATAVIATAAEYGLDLEAVRRGIASFKGIPRRLEYIGEYKARPVFYDYAHHPTEIINGIGAVRAMGNDPVTVLFKPHTYSRTAHLFHDFTRALSAADFCVIGDIFPAREENIYGVDSELLAKSIVGAMYSPDKDVAKTLDNLTRGTIILMGAADMSEILSQMGFENLKEK